MHAEIAELLTHSQPFLLLVSLILAPEEDRNWERKRYANAVRKSTSHKLRRDVEGKAVLWKVDGPEWNSVEGGVNYRVKQVTKNRVYEKIIVDQLLKLILAVCGAHKCHVRGHKTPLQDSGPKFRLDRNLRVISSKWRAFWTHCSTCGYFLTNSGRILYSQVNWL
jgi:hypothetical protein